MQLRRVMNGRAAVTSVIAALHDLPAEPLHEVIIQPWDPPGSTNQLKTIYMWYAEIAKYLPEDDEHGWRRYCKYHFGVPILIKDPQHYDFLQALFSNWPMPAGYEKRLAAMDYVDVVSIFSRKQRTEYMNAIIKHPYFRKNVRFTDPKPRGQRR